MENTLENKAKFFAQYWWQNCLRLFGYPNIEMQINSDTTFDRVHNNQCYLELKPISQITEEDYKGIPDLYYGSADSWFNAQRIYTYDTLEECVSKVIKKLIPTQYDYLRSKGYALPYMELSIETLQEYGWIKLKSE